MAGLSKEPKKKGDPGSALSDEAVQFILAGYARFDRPRQILAGVKEKFGLEPSSALLAHYNPTTNKKLSPKHVEYFQAARRHYLDHPEEYGIYHSTHRVAALEEIFAKAREAAGGRGNPVLAMQALNAARQETVGKSIALADLARVFQDMGLVVAKTLPPQMQRLHDLATQMCRSIADAAVRASADLPIKADPEFRTAVNGRLQEALSELGRVLDECSRVALETIEREWALVPVKTEKGSG